jgi:hypothetical protein
MAPLQEREGALYHFAIVVLVEVLVVMILGWTRQARQIERVPHGLHEHALRSERQHYHYPACLDPYLKVAAAKKKLDADTAGPFDVGNG